MTREIVDVDFRALRQSTMSNELHEAGQAVVSALDAEGFSSEFFAEIERLRKALAAPAWLPIETAPKDGSEFVAAYGHQGGVKKLVSWNTVHGYWQSKGEVLLNFENKATHWTPLPPLPGKALAAPSLSQRMNDAGFTARDTRIECEECGEKFTPQMLPIHQCTAQSVTDCHQLAAPVEQQIKALMGFADEYAYEGRGSLLERDTLEQALRAALSLAEGQEVCKCSMRTKLVGDGCWICNPKLAKELSRDGHE